MIEEPLVSLIVPVYNVEPYLEQCVKSVVQQTYQNLEILFVNDGSTDGSLSVCLAWCGKDSRIRVIDQENQGLGPARMRGVREAKGEFLAFVDSDDWVEPDFVRKMVERAVEAQAPIVYCDARKVWPDHSQIMKFPRIAESGVQVSEVPRVLNQCGLWTWNKLYRREVWIKLGVEQPAGAVEDICTVFVLLVKAGRIAQVPEPLYNYTQRTDSLTYADSFPDAYIRATKIARRNITVYNIDPKYLFYIGKIFGESLTFVKIQFQGRRELQEKVKEMEQSFRETFLPCEAENDCLIFGSFSLRSMLKEVFYTLPDYFGFSSLISAMNPPVMGSAGQKEVILPVNPNPFRADALRKEFTGDFYRFIKDNGRGIRYLYFDWMEERNDIIKLAKGGYVTVSEACIEAMEGKAPEGQIIKSGSEEFMLLWQESCRKLKSLLTDSGFRGKVVLVENRLSETYGDFNGRQQFACGSWICEVNHTIVNLEKCFHDIFHDADVCDFTGKESYYTDAEFVHGCLPWHLNVDIYSDAGDELYWMMQKKRHT